ncbi:uncharacterized protein LOC141690101 isoform X2 [Apium graveolens]|uniref:uncharacterized protein LOC141690101 isoform X2 n=1 Tax=Apium graveolens TaxID=4045 RepID=UPI003D791922
MKKIVPELDLRWKSNPLITHLPGNFVWRDLPGLELSSDLPTVFFVPLRFGCIVDGNAYVVVEKFKRDSFPVPKDKRRTAVRQMIELLIYLELNGVLHARLEPEKLVNVAGIPKFCSIPV